MSLAAIAQHPKFCSLEDIQSHAAAVEARPDVYNNDGTMSWDSVASGWNTACGDIPSNFTELSERYAPETGGLQIIENVSGFQDNAWTSSNFKVWKVKEVKQADAYPFGERAQTIETVAKTFSVNLFLLPTATSEIVGWMALQYEVCAYFADPSGAVPNLRLYKTTDSPLGTTDAFVQAFKKTGSTTLEYWAISPRYNDDGDGVGAAHFVSEETQGCPVWSQAEGNSGILGIIIILSILFAGVLLCLGLAAKRGTLTVAPNTEEDDPKGPSDCGIVVKAENV